MATICRAGRRHTGDSESVPACAAKSQWRWLAVPSSNTLDEFSHADFLNAYLESEGQEPVDFDRFRTLPSSTAAGAQQIGRLTNPMQLSVDTRWYTRYRSATNPDFGATFPQALPALFAGQFTAIPRTNAELNGNAAHVQAIANTAAFSLWLYRASWFEPLRDSQPAGVPPRSPEDHAQYRWRRDMPLSRMGGFLG
jgi:hypothetical protein